MGKKYSKRTRVGADKKCLKIIDSYKKIEASFAKKNNINLETLKKNVLKELRKTENLGSQTYAKDGKLIICLSRSAQKHYITEDDKLIDQQVNERIAAWNEGNWDCYYSSRENKFAFVCKNQHDILYSDVSLELAAQTSVYDPNANSGKGRFVRNKSSDEGSER